MRTYSAFFTILYEELWTEAHFQKRASFSPHVLLSPIPFVSSPPQMLCGEPPFADLAAQVESPYVLPLAITRRLQKYGKLDILSETKSGFFATRPFANP